MAYSLLGEYKAARVLVDSLTDQDRQNIAALLTDEKYVSLIKLQQNLCAQWIQQCIHEQGENQSIKKGGVMMFTTTQRMVKATFSQKAQENAEQDATEKVLNGIGW